MKLDFGINDSYNLNIQNGDFLIQNSELQQGNVIVKATNGEIRQFPLVGVALDSYIGATEDKSVLYNIITNQLANDNLIVDTIEVEIDGNNITFDLKIK